MARDPVCGMDVDEAKAAATTDYKGTTYYFCNPGCKKAFEGDPAKYVGDGKGETNGGAKRAGWLRTALGHLTGGNRGCH